MRIAVVLGFLAVAAAAPAAAAPVARTFDVPADTAWTATVRVLEVLGWDIDTADRAIGWITTDSRRVEGEDYGVYAKGLRHRLRVHVKAEGAQRTTITVERIVFRRERILWMNNDEAVATTDQSVEHDLLAAIGKSL